MVVAIFPIPQPPSLILVLKGNQKPLMMHSTNFLSNQIINPICMAIIIFMIGQLGLHAQYKNTSASGHVEIRVARPAFVDVNEISLGVGNAMRGSWVIITPYDGASWRFVITGEPSASFSATFPLQTTLYRTIGQQWLTGPLNELSVARGAVTKHTNDSRSSATLFIDTGVESSTSFFPGAWRQQNVAVLYFWIGGQIFVPQNQTTGNYTGTYIITIDYVSI